MSWASSALRSTIRGAAQSLVRTGAANFGNFIRSAGTNAFANGGRGPAKRIRGSFGGLFGARQRVSSTPKVLPKPPRR